MNKVNNQIFSRTTFLFLGDGLPPISNILVSMVLACTQKKNRTSVHTVHTYITVDKVALKEPEPEAENQKQRTKEENRR